MYNVIYNELVDAGVVFVLDCPVYTDIEGNEVTEDVRFGKKQEIKITHPDYVVSSDETGCNT